ncbi:MAG: hypothetical protein FJ280_06055 [Planctomycetes bacterium]|nr:hypothetical protein [Planctomycetota bacterium]
MSKPDSQQDWLSEWHLHPRSLELLCSWDDRRGVLLASADDSGESVIPNVVALCAPDHIIEVHPSFSNTQWEEATLVLSKKQIQGDLLSGPFPTKICLIVHRLHESPEWMLHRLQGLFERAGRRFVCIAATDRLEQIPGKYRSFFDEWT